MIKFSMHVFNLVFALQIGGCTLKVCLRSLISPLCWDLKRGLCQNCNLCNIIQQICAQFSHNAIFLALEITKQRITRKKYLH